MNETTRTPDESAGWTPLRLAVVAPLAGHNPDRPTAPLRVAADAIDSLMEKVAPRLVLRVADPAGGTAPVEVALAFRRRRDFTPAALIEQVPALKALSDRRAGAAPGATAETDAALTRGLDAIVHHPAYLELEAAWRGLEFLATRGQAGEGTLTVLHLEALVTGPGEDWTARFRTQLFDPDYEGTTEVPLAALLVDQLFDHQLASLERLAELGGLAAALQAPVVGSVGPPFFGLKNLAHLPSLTDMVTRTQGGAYAGWNMVQKEPWARWIGLTANRFLLRSPHGEGVDDATKFVYRETVDPAHPEWHCWGNPVWALGASLAASYAEHGHCAAADGLSGTGGHHDLPTRELVQGPGKTIRVTTEVVLPDEKAWDLSRAGLTPMLGIANGDIAYFPFLGNIYRPHPGSITMDQALTYQLYAGQVSHTILALSGRMPAGDPVEVCGWLAAQVFAELSPWVGDAPGTNVQAAPVALPDGRVVAHINVLPTFKIQDKALEFELQLPLR